MGLGEVCVHGCLCESESEMVSGGGMKSWVVLVINFVMGRWRTGENGTGGSTGSTEWLSVERWKLRQEGTGEEIKKGNSTE